MPLRIADSRERATPGDVAWLAAVPCTLLLLLVVVKLGPPLGEALFTPQTFPDFWPTLVREGYLVPEPTEHARFLLSLTGPLLLVAATALGANRVPRPPFARALVLGSQALLVAAALGCIVAQHVLTSAFASYAPRAYLTWTTIAVAALLALAASAVVLTPAVAERVRTAVRETRGRRIGALAAAVAFTALWLLPAINTEGSIGRSNIALFVNIPFWLDESFGVLNGRAPLTTFNPQYSQLWPYYGAAAMALLGASFTVWAAAMAAAAGAVMLAVYALLRRIVRHSLLALALFVPFVATSFFTEVGPLDNRWGPVNSASMFPMRYGGPYLLAWLTVRHLDGARPRGRAPLFLVAWLVAINNVEFGIPALGAMLAAVLWTAGRPTLRLAGRLAAELALGLAGAIVAVTALTLLVSGSLRAPELGRLFLFPRLYEQYGFANLPISPVAGLHLTIYATYVAAIAVGTVRALEARSRPLTGALVWVGVFGLGCGAYFAGRSHPDVLISLFSSWALALALLAVVAVRGMLASPARRLPTPAELAVLLGLGVALCSLGQVPRPWDELRRIDTSLNPPTMRPLPTERFVAAHTRPGERIAILGPLGHRIAHDVGVKDVMPYATLESMPTRELFDTMLDGLRDEGASKAFLIYVQTTTSDHEAALRAAGFVPVAHSGGVAEWVRDR